MPVHPPLRLLKGPASLPSQAWRAGLAAVLVIAVMMVLSLAGCSRSPAQRLDDARAMVARQDADGALVIVKALLQDQPDQPDARLLLGQLLLAAGRPTDAVIELERALGLGLAADRVVPPLAQALLAADRAALLVTRHGSQQLAQPLAQAQLKTLLAEAQASLQQVDDARASLSQALQAVPGHAPALLLQARLTALAGDLPGALAQVQALVKDQPGVADAWMLQGDLLLRQRAAPAALAAAWRQALVVQPAHAEAHAALVALALAQQDLPGATSQLQAMRERLPGHPRTLQAEGQVALQQGDLHTARDRFQRLLRRSPDDVLLLQSAGVAELRAQAPGQAEQLLNKAVQLAPDSAVARRLAAQAQLALGQPARVLALLEPLTGPQSADVEALTLAAQAQLLAGDASRATALFERAARLRPADPVLRSALALAKLRRGDEGPGLAALERAAADDRQGQRVDLALIATQLHRGDLDAALRAIDGLAAKQPKQPLPAVLRGQVLLRRGDAAGARAAFEQALSFDADHLPAIQALADLDLAERQPAQAQARYEALLQRQPRLAAAHLALARLAARNGAGRDAVAARLEAGIQANPDDLTLRVARVDQLLATAQPKPAVAAAQAALTQLPDQPELLVRLGRAQLQAGEGRQALASFNRLVALRGEMPDAHLGLAEAQLATDDLSGAGRSIGRALALAPGHLPAQRLQLRLALRQQLPAEALAVARAVQKQQPAQAAGWGMEAEVHAARRNWPPAIVALRQAITRADPQAAPLQLHQALLLSGQPAEAQAMAEAWLRSHPQDLQFLHHLGDAALARRDFAAAEARYRAVLAQQPRHAMALNNVAWLLLEQGRPGATALAEQAVQAAPDQPALRDTLARALAAEGRVGDALAMQKQAVALQPDDPGLRLQLAQLLLQTRDKRAAKAELDRLADLGSRFARQDEVTAALKALGR